jgi:hypothetical protein
MESKSDIENVDAWAEIIGDTLQHAPAEKRADILALAVKNEVAQRSAPPFLTLADLVNMDTPGVRHWNAILRLKGLLVQVFVRNITNNNSAEDAAKILFAWHRYGTGSGDLADYIDELPRPKAAA